MLNVAVAYFGRTRVYMGAINHQLCTYYFEPRIESVSNGVSGRSKERGPPHATTRCASRGPPTCGSSTILKTILAQRYPPGTKLRPFVDGRKSCADFRTYTRDFSNSNAVCVMYLYGVECLL